MTLTFRADINPGCARILFPGLPQIEGSQPVPASAWAGANHEFAPLFGAKWVQRWSGRQGHVWFCTFGLKLPGMIGPAYKFLRYCRNAEYEFRSEPIGNLARKVLWSLGLHEVPLPMNRIESVFIEAIHADPEDVATWMAYADWLTEQDDKRVARGQLIQGIFAKKAWPTKYGLPIIAGLTRRQ